MATVTTADPVLGRDLMIQFDVKLPSWILTNDDLSPVGIRISRARYVLVGIKIQNRLPNRIDLVRRNHVARKLSVRTRCRRSLASSAGIVDPGLSSVRIRRIGKIGRTLREVTGAFQVGRDTSFKVSWILLAYLFEIDKKERLVFLQRTTKRETILVPHVVGFIVGVEKVSRIKCRPLSVPPTAAVKGIRALLQDHIHYGPAIVTKLRRKAIVLNLELLHDLHRRLVID